MGDRTEKAYEEDQPDMDVKAGKYLSMENACELDVFRMAYAEETEIRMLPEREVE